MTDADTLDALLGVSRAAYDHARSGLSRILVQEADLRQALTRLADMERDGRAVADRSPQIRMAGADVLWQSWLGRSRTQLNLQLAQVLAQKEYEQRQAQRAFGKVAALEELIAEEQARTRKKDAQQALQRAIETALRTPPR